MGIRLIIAYILNLLDLLFTSHWIHKFGVDIEVNPIGKWMFEHNMAWPFKTFGMAAMLYVLYWLLKAHPNWGWTSWVILGLYSLLTVYHIVIWVYTIWITH